MRRSLSGWLNDQLQQRYDGPIPEAELRRVDDVASAERSLDDALAPIERAVIRLSDDYGDLLRETARLEASRQLFQESGDPTRLAEYRRRLDRVIERGRALHKSNARLLAEAGEEQPERGHAMRGAPAIRE